MYSLFRRSNETNSRNYKKYRKTVDLINELEEAIAIKTNEELRAMTNLFKERLAKGEKLITIIPEAFAVVREASKRIFNMRHFDMQLIGGLVLSEGNIAEMHTGEGKTLVASLPSYVRALEGKGVHVITVNEYLANRDFDQIGQIHSFLGLTVGLNVPSMQIELKKQAYNADITYGVGTEFGFDYLRDNMVLDPYQKVQRPYHFAIIDEVDSVLVDEAKTPLVIAGTMVADADLHMIAARLAKRFSPITDYDIDDETKTASLTETGIEKVEAAFGVDNLYDLEHQTLFHYVIQAVRANVMFQRDVDYIVKDDIIYLVDMFTGRIMEGRSLSDGLHQAIEANENVTISQENKAQAQITIQNYFRMYPLLCGMTGTAKAQEKEFLEVYGMDVLQIPTNRPLIRNDDQDQVYETIKQKYTAVATEVKTRHSTGQPVLVGTTSILQSEEVSLYLQKEGLEFQLLNAKSVEQEVYLISQAGQLNQITVATNMAGRGTDIILGEGVTDVGGLFVLGTEKHESRRIDNQLRGRSGRQGDPGTSQFFISLQDNMFTRYAKDDLEKFNKKIKTDSLGLILNKDIHQITYRTQRIVEGSHLSMREYNLKLDDVINEQRKVIYTLRNKVLSGSDLIDQFQKLLDETIEYVVGDSCHENENSIHWDFEQIEQTLNSLLLQPITLIRSVSKVKDVLKQLQPLVQELKDYILTLVEQPAVRKTFSHIMLSSLDSMWIRHLEAMSRLKEGIGLRVYQQEDPMRIYQREGLELFEMHYNELILSITSEITSFLKLYTAGQEEK